MAVIKCPECGNTVSDTLDQCIHCGYRLKEAKTEEKAEAKTEEKVKYKVVGSIIDELVKVESKWKNEKGLRKFYMSNAISWICFALIMAILIVTALVVYGWLKNDYTKVFELNSTKESFVFIEIALCAVISVFSFLSAFRNFYRVSSLSKWCKEKGISISEMYRTYIFTDLISDIQGKRADTVMSLIESEICREDIEYGKKFKSNQIATAILKFFSPIFAFLFFNNAIIEFLMDTIVYGPSYISKYHFDCIMKNLWAVIILIGIEIALSVLSKAYSKRLKESHSAWDKNNKANSSILSGQPIVMDIDSFNKLVQ